VKPLLGHIFVKRFFFLMGKIVWESSLLEHLLMAGVPV